MSSVNFNVRMDKTLKERAFPIIESYGLTPAQAIKLFLNQIADTRTIPLSFTHHATGEYNETMDPFFSHSNMSALNKSVVQMRRGKTVTRTLDELDALADE